MVIMADATIRTLLDRDPMGVPRIHSRRGQHSLRRHLCARVCVWWGRHCAVPYAVLYHVPACVGVRFTTAASAATLLNIRNARKHFERLEGVQSLTQ